MSIDFETRIRNVTAVLGPTNTGKTHLAIERMLGHESGLIGLPLRLLAREVYDKIVQRVGAHAVALVTGEEKIKPENARYWVCTVEAMPRDVDVDFLAIDEIQLAADPDRGHVFTDRLLHARARRETLLLGASTIRDAIDDLIPGANFISRPRLSKITYSGEKKITRLPTRTAIVAFSASEVYSIAELIRRQRGGAAVVLGALSPRTRNAQVALYQSGDVDFLVATDAIGMGLNLDVNHVAFAGTRKFDGHMTRDLTPGELAQIAGRAGRYMNDGTFGVTADVPSFDQDIIERLETHTLEPVKLLQWRNRNLDYSTVNRLLESLRQLPREQRLTRARMAEDELALETMSGDAEVVRLATTPAAVSLLWEVAQVPDYRKISSQNHAELVTTIYKYLRGPEERVPEDWFAEQVTLADRTDGDIDTLATRLSHIRTWTFVANRADWLKDPAHWQGRTRAIEDSLSDALHECLTQRFVDRRTSALMRGMRDKDELNAEIAEDGAIKVEDHYVGRLKGFRFSPDTQQADGIHGKAARNAAAQVVSRELGMRVRRVASAKNDAFKIKRHNRIVWRDEEIAELQAGENPLKPQVQLLTDEHMTAPDRERVQTRLDTWMTDMIAERLASLVEIAKAEDVTGMARGIAFQLTENLGVLKRDAVAEQIRTLDQASRGQLRKYGVRFGAFNIFFPLLLKPAAAELALALWMLKHGSTHGLAPETAPEPPRAGLTSIKVDPALPEAFYRAAGFHRCGPRSIRLDMLERLADHIRPLLAWRPGEGRQTPPKGSTGDGAFTVTPEMMSVLGCSSEELSQVLQELGFRSEKRVVPPKPVVIDPAALAIEAAVALASPSVEPQPDGPEAPAEAADGATVESDGAPEPKVEETIEVWRPRRHHRPDRSERPARGESRDRREHAGGERRRRPDGRGNQQRQHAGQRGPDGAPAANVETAEAANAPVVAAEAAASPAIDAAPSVPQDRGERRDRPDRNDRNERHGRPQDGRNRDRSEGDRGPRHGGPGGDKNRRDRGGDRNSRNDRDRPRPPDIRTAAPPRKSGAVDPDSPFAKLVALKQAMEKRSQDPGSS